jgi:hypothetical protein
MNSFLKFSWIWPFSLPPDSLEVGFHRIPPKSMEVGLLVNGRRTKPKFVLTWRYRQHCGGIPQILPPAILEVSCPTLPPGPLEVTFKGLSESTPRVGRPSSPYRPILPPLDQIYYSLPTLSPPLNPISNPSKSERFVRGIGPSCILWGNISHL